MVINNYKYQLKIAHIEKQEQSFNVILTDKQKALEDLSFLDEITTEEIEQNTKDNESEYSDDNYHKINSYVVLISNRTNKSLLSINESTNC